MSGQTLPLMHNGIVQVTLCDPSLKNVTITSAYLQTNLASNSFNFCHQRQFKTQKVSICLPIILPLQTMQNPKTNVFAFQLFCHSRQCEIKKCISLPIYYFAPTGNTRYKNECICLPIIFPPQAIQDPK